MTRWHAMCNERKSYRVTTVGALIVSALLMFPPLRLHAQELAAHYGGAMQDGGGSDAWAGTFNYAATDYTGIAVGYLNEIHLPGHHRDGFLAQAIGRYALSGTRLYVHGGVGIYRYFDTQSEDMQSQDKHGWVPIFTVATTYYTDTPWFYRLSFNRIQSSDDISTNSLLLGVGYDLWRGPQKQTAKEESGLLPSISWPGEHELTVFVGETVLNIFGTPDSQAFAMEYRQRVMNQVEWTLTGIAEGDTDVTQRWGAASEVWLAGDFFEEALTLAVGVGPYVFSDEKYTAPNGAKGKQDVAALISLTGAYRFAPHWLVRLSFNRVETDYDRDADLYLFGLGYHWT